jgi:ATP-dependent Lon protease
VTESIIPPALLDVLPILALRNSVLFPACVVPVNVSRARSLRLIEEIYGLNRPIIGVIAQRQAETEDPDFEHLYEIGTLARVLKINRLSSGSYSVVLQGIARMHVIESMGREPCLKARVDRFSERPYRDEETDALAALIRESARQLLDLLPQLVNEIGSVLDNNQEPGALADLVASYLPIPTEQKQKLLETTDLRARLRLLHDLLKRLSAIHKVKLEVASMVQEGISGSQRELLLRQQLKAIRRELGDGEGEDDELELLRERIFKAELPREAEKVARREVSRMSGMNPSSAEYQVAFNYVDWLAEIPWNKLSPDLLKVSEVRRVLEEDHHGLEKIKQRIVEYMAVRKVRKDKRGPILCFVGPPGVGKTSLGRSIARATGRKLVRISLGGVQDEAEIRGHRRTYVGALPGRLIVGLKRAGVRNPVFVLDEVDKMSADFSGDPASALLEALDPELNHAFLDHYVNLPVDLSQVFFIATANRQDKIPDSLLDRMEVIELPGYSREERLAIAREFLIPRQLFEHGLTPDHLEITDEAIARIVDEYAHEAGVRQLEQQLASLCRAVAVRMANGESVHIEAGIDFMATVLGPPRREVQVAERVLAPGISTSLAWSPAGGELLMVECAKMPGKGNIFLTGSMGDIMKESAQAAFSYVRSRADQYHLSRDFLANFDIHIHVPKGGTPKDGSSAGLSVIVSLLSLLTNVSTRADVATTGEITLRGAVLPVNGLKQKILAAHRGNIKHVVIPKQNEPDLEEIPESIRKELSIHLISRIEEAIPLVFTEPPIAPRTSAAPRRSSAHP